MEQGNRLLLPIPAFKWVALAALVGVLWVSSWLSRLGFSPGMSLSLAGLMVLCVAHARLRGRVIEALQTYRVWRRVLRGDLSVRNRLLVIAASMAVWFGLLVRGWFPADAALLALVVNEIGACTVAQELIEVMHTWSRRPYERRVTSARSEARRGARGPSGHTGAPGGPEAVLGALRSRYGANDG